MTRFASNPKHCYRIIGARWTKEVNMLNIRCGNCDAIFEHRSDKWTVRCPSCGGQAGLGAIREEYAKAKITTHNPGVEA